VIHLNIHRFCVEMVLGTYSYKSRNTTALLYFFGPFIRKTSNFTPLFWWL